MKYVLLGFFLLSTFNGLSQEIPASFVKVVDSIVDVAPKHYDAVHSILSSSRNDSVLMRYVLSVSTKKDYSTGICYALNELGRKYRNTTQYSKAIKFHSDALSVAERENNIELMVLSLNNLGVVYRRTSSIRMAMDYHQKALVLAEAIEEPSLSILRSINVSLNSIGNLYRMLEQYEMAMERFEKALSLEIKLGNALGQAVNYQNLGSCKEELGNLEGALIDYRTSLALNESMNSEMGQVVCNNSIAKIYLRQNSPEKALVLLEPTLVKARKLGDGFLFVPSYIYRGWAKWLLGKYGEAEKDILKGLNLSDKYNLITSKAHACHLLSSLYKAKGDFEMALDYNVKAEEIKKNISNQNTVRYVNDIILRYDSEKKSNEIEILAKENENVRLELTKNRTIILIVSLALVLLVGIFYIFYREYELKNEKKLLTLEQTMLRSQMNPHFLFNSLNSIKLYIINNEKKNAVHYLNKFSKFVRKVLEASSMREIPLDEELETAELYMNIENIRFSNEIDFEIKISDDIDVHVIKTPSLILQPFLENAIWHGLSSKTGDKKIVVDVARPVNKNYIQISITDNGIGRIASEKIKLNKVLKRKSLGIDITKERLTNFSKDYQNMFNLQIIDLFHEDGSANGTKVSLQIPTV